MVGRIQQAGETSWQEGFFGPLYGRVLAARLQTAGTLREARLVRKLLGLREGQAVLDCPCGQGRLAVQLARMGIQVTGVDQAAGYLATARRLARQEKVRLRPARREAGLHLVRADMRRIDFAGRFDAVVNWFSSFGYFSDDDNLLVARRALEALRPGGRFLLELLNKSVLLGRLYDVHEETINGVRIVNRPRWDGRTNRLRDTWELSAGRLVERCPMEMRVFNGREIRALLKEAGFADIRLYAHAKGQAGPFTRHSARFIAVARRR